MTIASDLLHRHIETLAADNAQWQTLIADDVLWELPYAVALGHPSRLAGNHHGPDVDNFENYGLTAAEGKIVGAPLIAECFANFECKLADTRLINRYGLFVFEVVKAHVAMSPRYPKTIHYRGDGVFMVSGQNVSYRSRFKAVNL
jgi:flavin reductase (DIM6/NTAB) family NADH-FMN oxidoreductase RutF